MKLTLRQRVDLLEAGHYDNRRRIVEAEDQTALLRGAVSEFSADLRAHRQECTERFDRIDQRFEGIDQRFEGIDQRFEGIEGMLRQILVLVTPQAGPEVARQGVATPAS